MDLQFEGPQRYKGEERNKWKKIFLLFMKLQLIYEFFLFYFFLCDMGLFFLIGNRGWVFFYYYYFLFFLRWGSFFFFLV